MKEKLQSIKEEAIRQIEASDVPEKLNEVRVKFLGKKGELTAVLKAMKDVAPEERPKVGQMVNETRAAIEELLEETKKNMERKIRETEAGGHRRHTSLEEKYGGTQPSQHYRPERGGAHFHRYGLRGGGGPGDRVRPLQL